MATVCLILGYVSVKMVDITKNLIFKQGMADHIQLPVILADLLVPYNAGVS